MTQDKSAFEPQSGKPAWFALVDSDAPSAQVSKVNKKLPVIALIVTGVIAASGTFFASASDENQSATTEVSSLTAATNSDASDVTVESTPESGAATGTTVNANSSGTAIATANGLQTPAQPGAQAPGNNGYGDDDDSDDSDDGDDGDEDDDDHDRRDRH